MEWRSLCRRCRRRSGFCAARKWGSACAGRCGLASLEGLPVDQDGVHYLPVPRQVVDGGLAGKFVVAVSCSEGYSFAIAVPGELYAWGKTTTTSTVITVAATITATITAIAAMSTRKINNDYNNNLSTL